MTSAACWWCRGDVVDAGPRGGLCLTCGAWCPAGLEAPPSGDVVEDEETRRAHCDDGDEAYERWKDSR